MNKKTKTVLLAAAFCLVFLAGLLIGKGVERGSSLKERQVLQTLNKGVFEMIDPGEGQITVVGHRSPDSDTVCGAVAYARLLTLLGFRAEAAVAGEVNRETAYILKEAGVDTPPVLEDASGKNIFLVDHSEYAQAAEGMKDAHIIGLIDHHGIGTVETGHQVIYEARPVGSTATIIWLDYLNYGLEIDKTTAFLLLGALLSDTYGLSGSTVTETDRLALRDLSARAGVTDVDTLYRTLHAEQLSYEGMSDEEIFFSDYKEYEAAGVKFGIGLVNAIDEETATALAERMKNVLTACKAKKDVDLMYASVGMRENGEKIDRIVPADILSKTIFEAAFPRYDEFDGNSFVFRAGLGRKTLFVPGLTDWLNANRETGGKADLLP